MFTFSLKRKPKTKITFKQFYDAVEKIGKETGATHFQVELIQSAHEGSFKMRGYLDTPPRFETGLTIEEVCEKLRNYKSEPIISPIKEVII